MKVRFLDGLRGLAAVIVVVDHFAIAFFQAATDASVTVHRSVLEPVILNTPLHLLVSGNFSVCIFFVLSGFVLSAKFFQTHDRRVVVASAVRRYIRLELPVLASVLLSWAVISLGWLQWRKGWLASLWQVAPSLPGAVYHATVGVFLEGKSSYNSVLWTMQAELVGSFLVFALLLAVGRWRYRWWVYGALLLGLMQSYLVCFVAGVMICDWSVERRASLRFWPLVLAASLYLGSVPVGTLAGTAYGWLGSDVSVPPRLHMIGAIGLVWVLVATPRLQRLFEGRVMRYWGRTSFGLYLTHLLILGSFSSWLFTLAAPVLGYEGGFVAMVVPSILLMGVVAYGFTRWIDEPAIRLSGWLYRHWFPRRWQTKAGSVEPAVQTVP